MASPRPASVVSAPVEGARYLLTGLRLIGRPGLRRFVALPLLINVLVFSGGIWWGWNAFAGLMGRLQGTLPHWLSWLEWLLWPLFVLALLIIVFYGFSLIANLIAAPFNGLLAEKTEALLTGRTLTGGGDLQRLLKALPGTLLDETGKVLYALLWSVPFLMLAFLVPVVGALIWFLFTAWLLAVQYSDYPMGNAGLKFRDMRRALRARRALALGFGAATVGLTMLPVLNFIAMPAAVAGATAMWVGTLRAGGAPDAASAPRSRRPA